MVTGEVLTTTASARGIAQGQNAIWFGGGLTHMAVNGATINRIDDLTFAASSYLATGLTSTGNKSTPTLKADMFGDWREELILRASGNRLGIVTTLSPTEYGIRTLMHDPMYRNGVANKNTGYDQIGFASFYLGDEAELPAMRTDISVPDGIAPTVTVKPDSKGEDGVYTKVSFAVDDAGKIDKYTLNGVEHDLADREECQPQQHPTGQGWRPARQQRTEGVRRGGQRHDRHLHAGRVTTAVPAAGSK